MRRPSLGLSLVVDDKKLKSKFRSVTSFVATKWRTFGAYFTTFIVSIAGPVWVHRLRPSDLSYPWRVKDSDLSSVYSLAQALGQSWTGLVHHSLGAPFNANLALAFIPDDLHLEILRVLVHVTRNPFTAVNLFYVLTYGLCGISFLFLCEQLKCNRHISMALAVAYAWLPYHFTRMNDGHIFLAAYYMIPIGLLVLLRLVDWLSGRSESFLPSRRGSKLICLLTVVATGSSGAYYGLFFALLALSTLVLIPRKNLSPLEALRRVMAVTGIAAAFVLAPLLRNLWARTHGLHSPLTRSPLESVQFGGSISRLYVPWGVWIPDNLRLVVERQEFEWLAVPLLAVLGIWILTISLVRRILSTSQPNRSQQLHGIQYLFFWSLLFFVAGGLSLVFAYGIDPSFRTWNRFGIIIMTAGLTAITLLITQRLRSKLRATAVALMILSLGFSTQLRPVASVGIGAEPDPTSFQEFLTLRRTARLIERTVPKGCSILQLPLMAFPEGGVVNGVGNGEHLWLPMLTRGYRWSYGAPKGSAPGDYWLNFSPNQAIQAALNLGFCGFVDLSPTEDMAMLSGQARIYNLGTLRLYLFTKR